MKTTKLPKFIGGIDNISKETDIPKGFVREALNVDFDKNGNVSTKEGYTLIYPGNCHSLFEGFFCEGASLKYIDTNNDVTIITGLVAENNYLSYCRLNDDLVFTDGIGIGHVLPDNTVELLAPPSPNDQPDAEQTAGILEGGEYQYALCNVSENGTISGTGIAKKIAVSHGSGIIFSGMETGNYLKALFISNVNGTEMYFRGFVPLNDAEYTLSNLDYKGYALDTQFMTQLPAGQIIRYFKGKLFVADNNILWFSQPLRYGLCKEADDYFQFPGRITVVEPVEDGIFVIADKTYFLKGTNSDEFSLDDYVNSDGAIEGSSLQVTGDDFGIESERTIAFWVSTSGLVLGLPGGSIKNLTSKHVAIGKNIVKGSSLYREVNGKKQILTSLNGGGETDTFTSTDTITSTIIRNGVEITE